MESGYTPTDSDIFAAFVLHTDSGEKFASLADAMEGTGKRALAYRRWMTEHDERVRAEAIESAADTYTIHTPKIWPLGIPVNKATLQSVWDVFVKPEQDSGRVQSIEMRALMACLRELYRALPGREDIQS